MADPILRLTVRLYGDDVAAGLLGEEATVASWLKVEAALARVQARLGVIPSAAGEAIEDVCRRIVIDRARLWEESRIVGYPILPLVRMIDAALPVGLRGHVHLGATTQDIMDTGLVLQVVAVLDRIEEHITAAGDALAVLVARHRATVMAGRTHGQQAVPTTFGAKCAVQLAELTHHLESVRRVRASVACVSLHGAGGTSAALGPSAARVREDLATELGLRTVDVPWHATRHRLADVGSTVALMTGTAVRFAREVATLAMSEIQELAEAGGHHRGASSTMPQKQNPILSEAVIGLGLACQAMAGLGVRGMEAQHERATGEWQAEMIALPDVLHLGASCVARLRDLIDVLEVDEVRMRANLDVDAGLIMAEAFMMALAPALGRERAHDVVTAACGEVRTGRASDLREALGALLPREERGDLALADLQPSSYLGETEAICTSALGSWGRLTSSVSSSTAGGSARR